MRDVNEQLGQALEALRAVMLETDSDGITVYVSAGLPALLGYAPEEIVGSRGWELVLEEDRDVLAEATRRIRAHPEPVRYTLRARHKSGHTVWLEMTTTLAEDGSGTPRLVSFARDVTASQRDAEARRASEDRFRTLTENATDLIIEIDDRGHFLFVSPNSQQLLGQGAEDLVGRSFVEFAASGKIHPEDREQMLEGFARTAASESRSGLREFRFLAADQTWHWFESRFQTYRNRSGEWRAVVISRDVTERKRTQEELRESEERYRVILAATHEVITEADEEGRLTYVSPDIHEVLGYRPEELVSTSTMPLLHPDDAERLAQIYLEGVRTGRPVDTGPYRVWHKQGAWRWLEGQGIPYHRAGGELRYIFVSRDITERRRAEEDRRALEERMQQAQRLEGLGVMAGGIAHDFNNLLTPILGDASLALMDLPEESPVRVRLQKIQTASRRAASLTNQMLAYAGQGPMEIEALDLSALVREMAQLLESSVGRSAELVYQLDTSLPRIDGDVAQLSQVVMNLLTNAAEAVGETGGRIAIRTGRLEVGAAVPARRWLGEDLPEGPAVFVEVEDNGCGMDDETRAHIFDPFFTTKFTGRGLGLAAALGIVRRHRGAIEIESKPGVGTRFRVVFPAAGPRRTEASASRHGDPSWRASATVLVVDDDEGVRELVSETLSRAGLHVLSATDGREGVDLFAARADEIGVVVLDRTMPTLGGEEVFEEIRRLRPDARIVLMSGYSQERASERFEGRGLAGFLHKPFHPEELLEMVRAALEG